jgi:hypothetical protein
MLCVIHCLLTPFAMLLIPLVGSQLSHSWFHVLMFILVLPIAVYALWRGYRLHRMKRVLWLGLAGLTLMFVGTFVESDNLWLESEIMICAGLILSAAHFINMRACRHSHS